MPRDISPAREEKPGPAGTRFQFAGVGTGNIPEGNTLPTGYSGRMLPAQQLIFTMQGELESGNVGDRMTAMRNRQAVEFLGAIKSTRDPEKASPGFDRRRFSTFAKPAGE